ncbi:MAG TPA: glycerol-3-phosphate 1-O-acyltransferase PlsY [Ktedonobacterales bacterium]|nr:glycerol-3-phosphate 1-O-acyltransferase PlsY [Ktedonobacterales bacterium]
MRVIASLLLGYIFGSFPSGVLIGRWKGVDVRRYGSGRTGATNVLRTLDPGSAALVAGLDMLKGTLPVLLTWALFKPRSDWNDAAAGMGAVIGHTHSIFLRFKGGRGVLTTGGAMLPMNLPIPWLALVVAAVPIALTRYISLGSMIGVSSQALMALPLALTKRDSWAHFAYALASAAWVVAEHHDNLQRLLAGTERKVGQKVQIASTPAVQMPTSAGSSSLPAQVR